MEKDLQIKGIPHTKVCNTCKEELALESFHKHSTCLYGRASSCKGCRSMKARAKYCPIYSRNQHLKYTYGISTEDYYTLLGNQNECCAICYEHISTFSRPFSVDHNHDTDVVRGLVCQGCNTLLALAADSIGRLQAAVEYLETRGSYG
jgi:hypothetical protein